MFYKLKVIVNYNTWLYNIAKGSLRPIADFMALLRPHDAVLKELFSKITVTKEGITYFAYYNGDRALTEFKIRCYKKIGSHWKYIGKYTPDFLIVQRKDGAIFRAIIVETKGTIYANDPTFQDKKAFIKDSFLQKNNAEFQYNRFDYLYLEDSESEQERINKTATAIKVFFEEV